MMQRLSKLTAVVIPAVVLWVGWLPATVQAQAFFDVAQDFTVDRACDATRSVRTGADPVPLAPGTVYAARGLNRKDNPTHVFLQVGSESRWAPLTCGRLANASAPAAPVGTAPPAAPRPGQSARGPVCLPFFDTSTDKVEVGVGGLVDVTPEPPKLDAFDKAINAVCGAPGKVVPEAEFKAMMQAHPAVLERLRAFTGGKVFPNRAARSASPEYLADLTEAWFAVKAFDHIFCGEPSSAGGGKIGGLHFHGRYLQMQEAGQACRMNNYRQQEVVPGVIYTMGVMMQTADGRMVQDARKGYGLTLSGEDLLKLATRGFAENPTSSTDSKACLLPVTDDGKSFTTVFVRRAAGIRTIYPDATPNGRGSRERTAPCATRVDLPPG